MTPEQQNSISIFINMLSGQRRPDRRIDALVGVAAGILTPSTMIGFPPGTVYLRGKTRVILTDFWERNPIGWSPTVVLPYSASIEASMTLLPKDWRMQLVEMPDKTWAAALIERKGDEPKTSAAPCTFLLPGLAIAAAAILWQTRPRVIGVAPPAEPVVEDVDKQPKDEDK